MKVLWIKKFYPIALVVLVVTICFAFLITAGGGIYRTIQSHEDPQILSYLQQLFTNIGYYNYSNDIYTVYGTGGVKIGYAFYGRGEGFSGTILLFIGLKNIDTIQGVIVISQTETPAYWASLEQGNFFGQFKGLKITDCYLNQYNNGGKIDAVTESTISSRGVTDGVRETALEKIKNLK